MGRELTPSPRGLDMLVEELKLRITPAQALGPSFGGPFVKEGVQVGFGHPSPPPDLCWRTPSPPCESLI